MAELIVTEAEKAAVSFLDWDDEALGKAVKEVALMLGKHCEDLEGFKKILPVSAAMVLASTAIDHNAGELSLTIGAFSHAGEDHGDWEVTVKKL